MKANSRRRVLISSIAMLLVALVALSTATYAWFTQSTSITANQISVKTVKASTLQISDISHAFQAETLEYGLDATYLPVSSANGINWFTANAESKTEMDAIVSSVKATGGNYFANQLNIKNAGESDLKNVTATLQITDPTTIDYLRVALVPVTYADNTPVANQLGTMAQGAFASNIYQLGTTSYDAINAQPAEGATEISVTPITNPKALTVGSKDNKPLYTAEIKLGTNGEVKAGAEYYYNLYVWFEGQDAECIDQYAGAEIKNITFQISGDTVYTTGN